MSAMIAKGNLHAHGPKLAAYLVTGKPGERAELALMEGFAASDLRDAFRDVEIMAAGTNAKAPFFHLYTRFPRGEIQDTPESRALCLEIARRQVKALGYGGQPYAVSFQTDRKSGELHMHIGISRIARSTDGQLFAIDPGLYKNRLKELSRSLEKEFALKEISSERKPGNRARAAKQNEFEESRRLKTNIDAIRNAILERFEQSDSGRAFNPAMQAQGYELTNGDRRNCFVVIDQAGGYHALNKALTGKTLAEIEARLSDLDRSLLRGATVVSREREQQQHQPAREAQEKGKYAGAADAPARANTPSDGHARTPQPEKKPLGKTAGAIREAAASENFAQGIKDRGLIFVYVTAEEAKASQRAHAFAKAAGRQNRAVKEGFGVVDTRGNLTRIDGRTAGEHWPKVQTQLAGIDRAELLSVAAGRAAMSDANRAAWAEQQRIDREKARPASFIEQKIINCENRARISGSVAERDGETVTLHGAEAFAAALDKAGIAVVRVTAADLPALDGLRRDEEFSRLAADVSHEARKSRHFDKLEVGELAAIDKRGNVYRLNPYRLDLDQIEAGLIAAAKSSSSRSPTPATSSTLPGVIEARAGFEIRAEQTAELWTQRRTAAAAEREARAEARDTRRELRRDVATAERAVNRSFATGESVIKQGFSLAGGAGRILSAFADRLLALFDFGFGASAAPTRQEAEGMERAADERQAEAADYAAQQETETARDWQQHAQKTQQQERNLSFAQRYGTPPTAEANLGREHDDERERGRELER